MESLTFRHTTKKPLSGSVPSAITGVVASGNLEILLERVLPPDACEVAVETPIAGYGDVWAAAVADFIARAQPGGLRISINDGGASTSAEGIAGIRVLPSRIQV